MVERSTVPRLSDMIEAIALVGVEMDGVTPDMLAADRRKRWLVERGLEIVSEASRHLPDSMKARHPEIPWAKVAGIGNVLRHEYQRIAHDILWRVVRDNLPPLERACQEELAAARAREQGGI